MDKPQPKQKRTERKPPPPPLGRVIRDGVYCNCDNCGSTMSKSGFLNLFGKRYCDNDKCKNSKQYKRPKPNPKPSIQPSRTHKIIVNTINKRKENETIPIINITIK